MKRDTAVFFLLMAVLVASTLSVLGWAHLNKHGGAYMVNWSSGDKITSQKLNQMQAHDATLSDVTGSRALATYYQNTAGKAIICTVTVVCIKDDAADSAYAIAYADTSTPPTQVVAHSGFMGYAASSKQKGYFTVTFLVPDQYYYGVNIAYGATSSVTLDKWFEVEVTTKG